jgi:DNA repair protein RadC
MMTPVEYCIAGVYNTKITKKIKESGMLMDTQLLDHFIIIPEGLYYSMADEGIV